MISEKEPLFTISIIQKTYRFFLTVYSCSKYFPKKDRYTLGQKIEQMTLELLELLFTANTVTGQERLAVQKQIDLKLKILKTMVRLCFDVQAMDQKRYLHLEGLLQEIGRMLGGWIKETKDK